MSDTRRRYRAIKAAIMQLYPTESRGNTARHLHTLAALVSGIVGSRSTNLPAIAGKAPDRTSLPDTSLMRLLEHSVDERKSIPVAIRILGRSCHKHSLVNTCYRYHYTRNSAVCLYGKLDIWCREVLTIGVGEVWQMHLNGLSAIHRCRNVVFSCPSGRTVALGAPYGTEKARFSGNDRVSGNCCGKYPVVNLTRNGSQLSSQPRIVSAFQLGCELLMLPRQSISRLKCIPWSNPDPDMTKTENSGRM